MLWIFLEAKAVHLSMKRNKKDRKLISSDTVSSSEMIMRTRVINENSRKTNSTNIDLDPSTSEGDSKLSLCESLEECMHNMTEIEGILEPCVDANEQVPANKVRGNDFPRYYFVLFSSLITSWRILHKNLFQSSFNQGD